MSIKSFFRRNLKKNKPIFIVDNSEELDNLDEELSKADIIGLDTEFDWRTTYFPKLSLIQIVANSKLFLIDCLKIDPSKVLKKYLESKNCLKIFHSVRSDATVLSKCLNIHSLNVFDIQVADKILTQSNIRSYGKIVKTIISCKKGKIIISGVGKSGIIGKKWSATVSSTGTPSFFLDPSNASHGDMGQITASDIVILISLSGESNELKNTIEKDAKPERIRLYLINRLIFN